MSESYRNLFSPLQVGPVTLPNRVFMPPHLTGYTLDHKPTEQHAHYYHARAKGGAGLIVAESASVHPTNLTPTRIAAFDEACVPGYRRIIELVHLHGTRLFIQLGHTGRQMTSFWTRRSIWAPSVVPCPANKEVPHEMDEDEIREVVSHWGAAARNSRAAGADGVEIHAGHGSLINQFLSPATNRRSDRYGGQLVNRMRLLTEVLEAARKEIGREMALGIRVSGDELVQDGLKITEMVEMCRAVEQTGLIDYISVSAATHKNMALFFGDSSIPHGSWVPYAHAIQQSVSLPVGAVMRITTPEMGERIVASGQAAMVGMVRALIADPELPNKARAGDREEVRHCIGFNQECRRGARGGAVACVQNPEAGVEARLAAEPVSPPAERKRVVVVGGGPAGMEAAIQAAARGHAVSLYEKSGSLGGQVLLGALAPTRGEVMEVVRYRKVMLRKHKVDVVLNTGVTAELLLSLSPAPDVVIIATGSQPYTPSVQGAESSSVRVVHPTQILTGEVRPAGPVVAADSGEDSYPLLGAVEYLANQGLKVDLITPMKSPGEGIAVDSIPLYYKRLMSREVTFWAMHGLDRLEGDVVVAANVYNPDRKLRLPATTLIMGYGNRVNDTLIRQVKGKIPTVHAIGDCVSPRQIADAIREGWSVARQI